MNEFWLIRHGESEANIGGRTLTPDGIPLTARGREQARHVAERIHTPPAMIVYSPYLRTYQTAQPLMERFPDVPLEIWEIHEYTFLSPTEFYNTTLEERRPAALAYWERANPLEIQGDGAESFGMFMARANTVIDRLTRIDTALNQRTLIYTHETFMKAVMWSLLMKGELSPDRMRLFRNYTQGFSIPNCGCLKLGFAGETVCQTFIHPL